MARIEDTAEGNGTNFPLYVTRFVSSRLHFLTCMHRDFEEAGSRLANSRAVTTKNKGKDELIVSVGNVNMPD